MALKPQNPVSVTHFLLQNFPEHHPQLGTKYHTVEPTGAVLIPSTTLAFACCRQMTHISISGADSSNPQNCLHRDSVSCSLESQCATCKVKLVILRYFPVSWAKRLEMFQHFSFFCRPTKFTL